MTPRQRGISGNQRLHQIRDTSDCAAGVLRQIAAFGKRVGREDPDGLRLLQAIKDGAGAAMAVAVEGLRHNHTDGQIGQALGITRQAVEKRWPRPETEAPS
jgi:hypothetical protein